MAPRLPLPIAESPVASNEMLRGNDDSSTEISSVPSGPFRVSVRWPRSSEIELVVAVLGTATQNFLTETGLAAEIVSERLRVFP
jgi:hypothetical protein